MAVLTGDEVNSVDPVEEIRLRTWARKHYASPAERDEDWHPIILDEMSRKDQEAH
jgi:hypothetical protein